MSLRFRLFRLAIAVITAALVWVYWVSMRGLIWGSVFWFIFHSGGMLLARIHLSKEWPL